MEPISRWEVYMAAFTLQLWVLFLKILPLQIWTPDCINAVLHGEVNFVDEVKTVHDCIKTHRSQMLAGITFLLLGFPIIVAHVNYFKRVFETMFAFLNSGLIVTMYTSSWLIVAAIYCTVFPALVIVVVYYDWEFAEGLEYVGHAMQFKFFQLCVITHTSTVVALGIVGAIPWLVQIFVALGWMRSVHYKFTEETRYQIVK